MKYSLLKGSYRAMSLLVLGVAISLAVPPSPANAMLKNWFKKKEKTSDSDSAGKKKKGEKNALGGATTREQMSALSWFTDHPDLHPGQLFIESIEKVDPSWADDGFDVVREEFLACGIFNGTNGCLDATYAVFSGVVIVKDQSVQYISPLGRDRDLLGLALVGELEFSQTPPKILSLSFASYDRKTVEHKDLRRAFEQGHFKTVATLRVAENPVDFAVRTLDSRPDFRKLYSVSKYLLSLKEGSHQREIEAAFQEQHSSWVNLRKSPYPLAFFDLARDHKLVPELVETLARSLLDSEDETSAQHGAVALAMLKIQDEKIRAHLTTAVASSSWRVRRDAVLGLEKIRNGLQDDLLVFGRLEDNDKDVKQAVDRVLDSARMDNSYLPILVEKFKSNSWKTRQQVLEWIGTILTPEATRAIYPGLMDSDKDVRATADSLLRGRAILLEDLPVLSDLSNQNNSDGKELVVKYLPKINHPDAIPVLTRLGSKGEPSWKVRLGAVKGLSTFKEDTATLAILSAILDTDKDVAAAAKDAISERPLNESHVSALEELSKAGSYQLRILGCEYLGRVNAPTSTHALLRRLCDTDQDVRRAAHRALKGREFGSEEIKLLDSLGAQTGCKKAIEEYREIKGI
ncbi:MAG: hypothetical protein HYX41_01760 [Bdellovibrio sp.]|nr:hypothetical protein [Bdellovibrio sp.]